MVDPDFLGEVYRRGYLAGQLDERSAWLMQLATVDDRLRTLIALLMPPRERKPERPPGGAIT